MVNIYINVLYYLFIMNVRFLLVQFINLNRYLSNKISTIVNDQRIGMIQQFLMFTTINKSAENKI